MYQLRPYQQAAVNATLQHFRSSREPAVLVLPTGAGKSLVIAELARLAQGRVLILAHVRELVEQNHAKYAGYGLQGGIYSAGLARKDTQSKVIFGSIQSVARADAGFFRGFSLLIIDECHRVSIEEDTQYATVIHKLRESTPDLCILGLTATPYRLGMGFIYEVNHRGMIRSESPRFFKKSIFELSLGYLIRNGYLTPPVKIDSPVACYDFSSLMARTTATSFAMSDVEGILKDQERVTPGIVKNILEMSEDRQGVMIFTASVRHAEEIMSHLPGELAAIVVGETPSIDRDKIIQRFKQRDIKFLVNVSVLTTGFDAPHVDLIAILRPTESVSLYQQIVGRGLRLSPGKSDCLILDYTGVGHDIFSPEIAEDKPSNQAVVVAVVCPECGNTNQFWGIKDSDGEMIEHYGRKCAYVACGFRFRFKRCGYCGAENDTAARQCLNCNGVLVDNDKKLRDAMQLKDAHVLRPDSMVFDKTYDKKGNERLEIRYYDCDGQFLREFFYLRDRTDAQAFYYNFTRMHLKLPENRIYLDNPDAVLRHLNLFRIPAFVIARRKNQFWVIREKIFDEGLKQSSHRQEIQDSQ